MNTKGENIMLKKLIVSISITSLMGLSNAQGQNLSTLEGIRLLCIKQVEHRLEFISNTKPDSLEEERVKATQRLKSCESVPRQNQERFFKIYEMYKKIQRRKGRNLINQNIALMVDELRSPPEDSWIKRMPGTGQVTCLKGFVKAGYTDSDWIISMCQENEDMRVFATSFFQKCMIQMREKYSDLPFYPFISTSCKEGSGYFNGKKAPSISSIVGVAMSEVSQGAIDLTRNILSEDQSEISAER